MTPLPERNAPPESTKAYIHSLGYCCSWGFFRLYPGPKWTQLVADRLGVSARSVRTCRAEAKECPHSAGCKLQQITSILLGEAK